MQIKNSNLIDELKEILHNNIKDEFKLINKTKFTFKLLCNNREDIIRLLLNINNNFNKIDSTQSSLGIIKYKNKITLLIKPFNKQGRKGGGLENEDLFFNIINKIINDKKEINILFKSKEKNLLIKDINKIIQTGTNPKGNKKSDIQLLNNNEILVNISLKQLNATLWESADKKFNPVINNLIYEITSGSLSDIIELKEVLDKITNSPKNNIFKLYNKQTKTKISGLLIPNIPEEIKELSCFGTDNPKTIILKETFNKNNFKLIGNYLIIKSKRIYNELKEIKEDKIDPILQIRHDVSRSKTFGLRPIISYKSLFYKDEKPLPNTIELDYNIYNKN